MNSTNRAANRDTIHILIDLLYGLIAFGISVIIWKNKLSIESLRIALILLLTHLLIFYLSNAGQSVYDMTIFFYRDRMWKKATNSFILASGTTLILYYGIVQEQQVASCLYTFLGIFYVFITLNVMIFKNVMDKIIRRKNLPRTVYVGSKDSYNKFQYFIGKTTILGNDIGYISYEDKPDNFGYIGALKDLAELIRTYNIEQVYFMHKREFDTATLQKYIDICIEMGVPCRIIIDTYRRRRAHSYVSSVGTYPVITYHNVSMNPYQRVIKRFFDIVISLIAIVLTSPIMLFTAIAIKIDSKGPVLFRQVRVGKNGRHFKIWKFRSMYIDAEERKKELMSQNEIEGDGLMFKMKDDPRITKVGKVIRKLSIDELPQFFNVLSGSMSVVGTRPPTLDEVEKYHDDQWRRISIKPGITGMWQVSGRSNIKSFDEVVRLDLEYIDTWRLLLDVKIFFKTFVAVFRSDGSC